jgi:hypothetical protein
VAVMVETVASSSRISTKLLQPLQQRVNLSSLIYLQFIAQEINCTPLFSERKIIACYTKAVKDCQKFVIEASGLTSQHLLHSLVIVGFLHVPQFFTTFAVLATDTCSYKELKK